MVDTKFCAARLKENADNKKRALKRHARKEE